jgi:putative chitinase
MEMIIMGINIVEAIKKISPKAMDNYLQAIQAGDTLFRQHGITTPLRMAHFMAQALHETGGFSILRENMSYSKDRLMVIFGVNHHSAAISPEEAKELARNPEAIAERVYGLGNPRKASELGNTQPGDGFNFRGNGVLQTTGRGNHRRLGSACGVNFEIEPDLVTAPEHALKPALQEWTQNSLNEAADRNDINAITRCINGGFNGIVERESWFNKIWPLLKADDQPAESWKASDEDERVKWLQQALNDLGAGPQLIVDGRFGPATRKAVINFQSAAGLTADGIAGPVTEAAIRLRLEIIR